MKVYFAHSLNENGEKHLLAKHLCQTAELAESFACSENYKSIFKITGMLHDFGKYQPPFQNYLENGGRRGSVPHAKWGAGYARRFKINYASIAIDGHHKGLPNRADWKNDTNQMFYDEEPGFDEVKNAFLADTGFDELVPQQNLWVTLGAGRSPSA